MNIECLNLLKSPLEGRKKENRGDVPIWVIMHTYIWKYHKETPCVAILNNMFVFSLTK
jgi:hypothetical protein